MVKEKNKGQRDGPDHRRLPQKIKQLTAKLSNTHLIAQTHTFSQMNEDVPAVILSWWISSLFFCGYKIIGESSDFQFAGFRVFFLLFFLHEFPTFRTNMLSCFINTVYSFFFMYPEEKQTSLQYECFTFLDILFSECSCFLS